MPRRVKTVMHCYSQHRHTLWLISRLKNGSRPIHARNFVPSPPTHFRNHIFGESHYWPLAWTLILVIMLMHLVRLTNFEESTSNPSGVLGLFQWIRISVKQGYDHIFLFYATFSSVPPPPEAIGPLPNGNKLIPIQVSKLNFGNWAFCIKHLLKDLSKYYLLFYATFSLATATAKK